MAEKSTGRSRQIAAATIHEALKLLKDAGGEMQARALMNEVGKRVPLDEWARARYEKTGYVRWESIFAFYSIGAQKAGLITKKKGIWFLTPEGDQASGKKPLELLDHINQKYAAWRSQNPVEKSSGGDEAHVDEQVESRIPTIEEIEQQAFEGIQAALDAKSPYEMQDLAAALLRGMGYYTPFNAAPGKDGGIDVVAYRDPIGTLSPRIKVQVKHKGSTAGAPEVRQLMGILQKDGDVGIFISTGGYSADAKSTARSAHVHVELIDAPRFIALWQEFYEKLTDEDKALLPLRPVYFFASNA